MTKQEMVLKALWENKLHHIAVEAYAELKRDVILEEYTGKWENGSPVMKEIRCSKGTTVRINMISRLGDIGITNDLGVKFGYKYRTIPLVKESVVVNIRLNK